MISSNMVKFAIAMFILALAVALSAAESEDKDDRPRIVTSEIKPSETRIVYEGAIMPTRTLHPGERDPDPKAVVHFIVSMRMRHRAELEAKIQGGHVIAQDEMQDRYLPRKEDCEAIVVVLKAAGMDVNDAYKQGKIYSLIIVASGTVKDVEALLMIKLKQAKVEGDDRIFAINAPSLPEKVGGPVESVIGFDDGAHKAHP